MVIIPPKKKYPLFSPLKHRLQQNLLYSLTTVTFCFKHTLWRLFQQCRSKSVYVSHTSHCAIKPPAFNGHNALRIKVEILVERHEYLWPKTYWSLPVLWRSGFVCWWIFRPCWVSGDRSIKETQIQRAIHSENKTISILFGCVSSKILFFS